MKFSASIIIPVFNEINIIEKFTNKLIKTFNHIDIKYIFPVCENTSNKFSKKLVIVLLK